MATAPRPVQHASRAESVTESHRRKNVSPPRGRRSTRVGCVWTTAIERTRNACNATGRPIRHASTRRARNTSKVRRRTIRHLFKRMISVSKDVTRGLRTARGLARTARPSAPATNAESSTTRRRCADGRTIDFRNYYRPAGARHERVCDLSVIAYFRQCLHLELYRGDTQ